jgi:tape measure domain-containing protein
MARDVESLVLTMSADLRRFEKSMQSMSATADKRLTQVEARARASQRNLEATMAKTGEGMSAALSAGLARLAPTLAGALGAGAILAYADSWNRASNQLASAGVAAGDLAGRQSELVDLANRSLASTEATVTLYARLTRATEELGTSSETVLRVTELVNKSFAASGATTIEAAAGVLQLSQAIASGVLQGDELRSLRETSPEIIRAIAQEMGVGIGALKKLGAEGKITSEIILSAIQNAGDGIEGRFNAMTPTVMQSMTILNNEFGRFVGEADKSLGVTKALSEGIIALSKNLDDMANIVTIAAIVIGSTLVGRAVAGAVTGFVTMNAQIALTNLQMTAMEMRAGLAAGALGRMSVGGLAASGSMTKLSASMAFFGGPIGLAVTGLAAGIGILAMTVNEAQTRTKEFNEVGKEYNDILRDAAALAEEAARRSGDFGDGNAAAVTGTDALCDATTKLADETFRLADAQQEAMRSRIANAYDETRALLEKEQNPNVLQRGMEAILPVGGIIGGMAVGRQNRIAALENQLADLRGRSIQLELNGERATDRPTRRNAGGSDGGGRNGKTEAERQAELRATIALEEQLAFVRATGSEAQIKAEEERQALIALTARYEAAGIENAAVAATEQLARLNQIAAAAEQREEQEKAIKQAFEDIASNIEKGEEAQERSRDIEADRLSMALQLAYLSGNVELIQRLEREQWINERINELIRMRPELNAAAARAQANGEADFITAAGAEGDMRETFRRTFSDGIRAALEGDLPGFFESMADRFTDRLLDNLADDLFDLLSEAGKGLISGQGRGGGGGWLGAILSAVTGSFGGMPARASGGSVTPHHPFIVGERRPEVFVPTTAGTIIPSVNAAMNRMSSAQGVTRVDAKISIDLSGANGEEAINRSAMEAAAQGAMFAVARARSENRAAARRAGKRFV